MSVMPPRPAEHFSLGSPQMTALRAIFLLAAHHGLTLPASDFPDLAPGGGYGPALARALGAAGCRCRLRTGRSWSDLVGLGSALPVLIEWRSGHWVILVQAGVGPGQDQAAILDPSDEGRGLQLIDRADLAARWTGTVLLARPARATAASPFGLRSFVPALLAERGLLTAVAVATVFGNLIAYSLPLLLQTIVDRVIAYSAWNTLIAVIAVYLLLIGFEAGFSYVRQRLMLIAGGRVDARIGAEVFRRLSDLPLHRIEGTPPGVMARHMQMTEKVRHFLTGRLFSTLLDAALLPILFAILLILSPPLTAVVGLAAVLIAGVIAATLPGLNRRLQALYVVEAQKQGNLVETLAQMRTIKSLGLEDRRRRQWEDQLAGAVTAQWHVGQLGALAGTITALMERGLQVAVIGGGAALVLSGQMTVGALIAFLMLSARVTAPFIQIAALIGEWQEAALAVRTLKPVLDHPPERLASVQVARPSLRGEIAIQDLRYSYPGSPVPSLDGITLSIPAGSTLGIVGRSGSGKTTLTRLLQGIDRPQGGAILFDGQDGRGIDLSHLRRQVGIVLQDTVLFRGTLRDNILGARTAADPQAIRRVIELSGVAEFLDRLPAGLDTDLGETATSLSGGQRQRVAIARALLQDPPILILDEATSALDPETEAHVLRNLAQIGAGRTLIMVSHRLRQLVRADRIAVLDRGRLIACAPHAELLATCPLYRNLWQDQEALA